ncbi:hypothetical protein N9L47_13540 [Rhodobacteraceae bacterium]|nr:hypothetical protein [Paracoccaceae bacterium]
MTYPNAPHGRRPGSARPAPTGLALLHHVSNGKTFKPLETMQPIQPRPAGLTLPGLLVETSL